MVPPIKLYLVGGYLQGGTLKDIDIVGVMGERDFTLAFGYTHETLQEAYKNKVGEKFDKYIQSNRVTGWVLTQFFDKKVDFKWIPPTMLYNPHVELHLEADVTMYL